MNLAVVGIFGCFVACIFGNNSNSLQVTNTSPSHNLRKQRRSTEDDLAEL